MNHSVPQNDSGDAAYQRAITLAQEILPNGPVGIKMAKQAINKGMEVIKTVSLRTLNIHRHVINTT